METDCPPGGTGHCNDGCPFWINNKCCPMPNKLEEAGVSWVIVGSQTKPYRPPTIEAVDEIVRACDKVGVKVFLKDNLKPLLTAGKLNGKDVIESHNLWAFKYFKLRQELPQPE